MTFEGPYQPQVNRIADEFNIGILKNAYHRFSQSTGDWLEVRHHPQTAPLVIDSGGFNVLRDGYSEYPWSVEDYHGFLTEYPREFDWAAVMDFVCSPQFNHLKSKQNRLDQTLENTIAHYDLDPDYQLLPVLQGESIHDYLSFYDRLNDHGIPTDVVGLGTLMRISGECEIKRVEQGVRANTDVDRFHGFGIKVSSFKVGASFESADSRSWGDASRHKKVYIDDGDRLIKRPHDRDTSKFAVLRSFHDYYNYAHRLQSTAYQSRKGEQTNLTDWNTQPTT